MSKTKNRELLMQRTFHVIQYELKEKARAIIAYASQRSRDKIIIVTAGEQQATQGLQVLQIQMELGNTYG